MTRKLLPSRVLLLLASLAPIAAATDTGEWRSWAGPNGDLTVDGAGLFDAPAFGLELAWVRPLGSAYSGLTVADGKLVTALSDGRSDLLAALDAETGETLWRYEIGEMYVGHDGSHDGPNGTPLIADGRVYFLGPSGHLLALDLDSGEQIFAHRIGRDHGAKQPAHGFATSPTLVQGVLVVQTGGSGGRSISGFDAASGRLLWQTGGEAVEYQSPISLDMSTLDVSALDVSALDGSAQRADATPLVLAVTGESLLGLVPRSGGILFRHAHGEPTSFAATQPVPLGGGKVLLAGRRGSGLYRVGLKDGRSGERRDPPDDGYVVEELWKSRALRGSYTVPVPHEGHLYGYSGRFLTCVDVATGETVWKSRPPGPGTLVLVDGHLVILTQSGELVVAEASAAGFAEKARLEVLGEGSLATPSFADGRFYVRDFAHVAAIDVGEAVRTVDGIGADERGGTPEDVALGRFGAFVERVRSLPDAAARKSMLGEFLASQERFPIVEDGHRVHFVFAGEVEDLALAGNFHHGEGNERVMARIEGTDFYYRSLELSPAAHYTYRFLVFGQPRLDPRNPRTVEEPLGAASELAMPGWPEPRHIEEPEGSRGRFERFTWASERMGEERQVEVYLPAGYAESDERYPLLVVNEGDEALRFGKMANSLDNLSGRRVAPLVVAFVPARGLRELASIEGLGELTEAMASELLPVLESRYRLLEKPGSHAIMGTGFGASHAVFAALDRPEIFGRVAVQSYLAYRSEEAVAAMLESGRGDGLRVFVELNSNDLHFATWARADVESRRLVKRLRAVGAEVVTVEVADGPGWSSWRSRTDAILEALFPPAEKSREIATTSRRKDVGGQLKAANNGVLSASASLNRF